MASTQDVFRQMIQGSPEELQLAKRYKAEDRRCCLRLTIQRDGGESTTLKEPFAEMIGTAQVGDVFEKIYPSLEKEHELDGWVVIRCGWIDSKFVKSDDNPEPQETRPLIVPLYELAGVKGIPTPDAYVVLNDATF